MRQRVCAKLDYWEKQVLLFYRQLLHRFYPNSPIKKQKLLKIDLNDKRGELAKNLSGGQKRKLCLAIALIGNSKIILLDHFGGTLLPLEVMESLEKMQSFTGR